MQLDDLFWLTLLVVFVLSIVLALIRARRKDKCLEMFDDYHVTVVMTDGSVVWGDLLVTSSGVELSFDAPYETRRSLMKGSVLLFPDDLTRCLALCRTVHALTDDEARDRERQVRRSVRQGAGQRLLRWLRSIQNSFRDGVQRSMGVLTASLGRAGPIGVALQSQKGSLEELGGVLVGGQAFEPLLERHIGRPVVLDVKNPEGAPRPTLEIPGTLVEYTQAFLSVFSLSHEPLEVVEVALPPASDHPFVDVQTTLDEVVLRSKADDPLVVRTASVGGHVIDFSVVLVPGAFLSLRQDPGAPLERVVIERVRAIDVVVPRSAGKIRFASDVRSRRAPWRGRSPSFEAADGGAPQISEKGSDAPSAPPSAPRSGGQAPPVPSAG